MGLATFVSGSLDRLFRKAIEMLPACPCVYIVVLAAPAPDPQIDRIAPTYYWPRMLAALVHQSLDRLETHAGSDPLVVVQLFIYKSPIRFSTKVEERLHDTDHWRMIDRII